jgi:hypothetical protein
MAPPAFAAQKRAEFGEKRGKSPEIGGFLADSDRGKLN